MGKILKLLQDIENTCFTSFDVEENKEELFMLAYISRIGILDRMEVNAYLNNPNLKVVIPTGLFSTRKETMSSGLAITIGKIKEIAALNHQISRIVDNILNRGSAFDEFEAILPEDQKQIVRTQF